MRKRVVDARRRAKVSEAADQRYLEALANVAEPVPLKTLTESLSRPVYWAGRRVRGLNLPGRSGREVAGGGRAGRFLINGFRNRDLQAARFARVSDDPAEKRRRSGHITRQLRMLRAHGLIKKLPHTHRYLVSAKGQQVIAAVMDAREVDIAQLTKAA